MSIVPLSSIRLIGAITEQATILETLQVLGCCHLTGVSPDSIAKKLQGSGHSITNTPLQKALRYLLDAPQKRHQEQGEPTESLDALVADILDNHTGSAELSNQLEHLEHRIDNLIPWGDFKFPEQGVFGHQRCWFYQVPNYKLERVRESDLNWAIVNQDERINYVLVLAPEEPEPGSMPVARTETGSIPLNELKAQRYELQVAWDELQMQRHNYTRWLPYLSKHLAASLDSQDREQAKNHCVVMDELFMIDGWVPVEHREEMELFARKQGCVLVFENKAASFPPTLLKNNAALSAGEDLVQFYQTPAYSAWDPSSVLFFSFAIFFAMILADAGYALLLLVGLALGWRKLGKTDKGKRMRLLGAVIGFVSMSYGVLCGSYFGLAPYNEGLAQLQLLDINNFDQMLSLSVIVGAAHLLLANGIGAWHLRGSPRSDWHLGWMLIVLCLLILWLQGAFSTLDNSGPLYTTAYFWLIIAGTLLVIWNSYPKPVNSVVDVMRRIGLGVISLADISKAFGDVLSYLRLFALGLASASLAVTCNEFASQLNSSMPDYGFILAGLVWLLGHSLNLVLAVVSGVVHGLRLNFIEFYHWSLSDEGYPFKPYKKRELAVWN
ncbi:MAG: hypothetical protein V7699_00765 [Porticoccus sp.]